MMKQMHGATLAVTLILLFVVTLLAISALQVTHMQEKMSANLHDKELSFNAAEAALSAGEAWIIGLLNQPPVLVSCTAHPCVHESHQNLDYTGQSPQWWQSNAAQYTGTLANVKTPPRYIVEFLQFVPDSPIVGDSSVKSTGVFYYQITARGTGASDNAISILQTTIGRRF